MHNILFVLYPVCLRSCLQTPFVDLFTPFPDAKLPAAAAKGARYMPPGMAAALAAKAAVAAVQHPAAEKQEDSVFPLPSRDKAKTKTRAIDKMLENLKRFVHRELKQVSGCFEEGMREQKGLLLTEGWCNGICSWGVVYRFLEHCRRKHASQNQSISVPNVLLFFIMLMTTISKSRPLSLRERRA